MPKSHVILIEISTAKEHRKKNRENLNQSNTYGSSVERVELVDILNEKQTGNQLQLLFSRTINFKCNYRNKNLSYFWHGYLIGWENGH